MKQSLHRFFRAARGAGVRISPAESIDAMRAISQTGISDREILRNALLLTLAKNRDEKAALSDCFDLFFQAPDMEEEREPPEESESEDTNGADGESDQSGFGEDGEGEPSEGGENGFSQNLPSNEVGTLANMLLSQDPANIAAALAAAAEAANLTDIRFFTQRGLFSSRMLEALGIERLREDIEALNARNPLVAERLTDALAKLREAVSEMVTQALALYAREERENLRHEILQNAPLARLEPRQIAEMRVLIRQIARRLRERYSKPRKRQRRGHLDVRRTLRRNSAWGGVPFLTSWKRKRHERPKIVALCDVSGSVARVSDFFLLLIHSLHEVVPDVHSFAFSGHLVEVSAILNSKSPEDAMNQIMADVGMGSSDYGNSFLDFEKGWMSTVTPQTTVIVLGDARNNKLNPRADILKRVSERAKRLVWLNPEGRMAWSWGDSEMMRYATFCNVVRQCATAKQLERAISDIVASYH